jgi:hypothetical protein
MNMYRKKLNVLLVIILGYILVGCARENYPELANESNQLNQCIYKTKAYTYYEKMEYMRKEAPYTYMTNKYLDIALEYLYGWDERYIKMEMGTKLSMLDNYMEKDPKVEITPLCKSELDEFFNKLNDDFVRELNSFDVIRYRIEEGLKKMGVENVPIEDKDMIVRVGRIGYSKLEILKAIEFDQPLMHESFNLEEEIKNTDCDCESKPIYAPSSNQEGPNRLVQSRLFALWNKEIRYRNYRKTCPDINEMRKAMNEWEMAANHAISFREIPDNGWNRFTWGIGCNYHVRLSQDGSNGGGISSTGAVPWAFCNIGKGAPLSTYLHELGHILGLLHEQSRPDRDCYIDIHWENMDFIERPQFHKFLLSRMYGDFDFKSIMLYDSYAFSNNNKATMTKKDGTTFSESKVLSPNDVKYIQYLYH